MGRLNREGGGGGGGITKSDRQRRDEAGMRGGLNRALMVL